MSQEFQPSHSSAAPLRAQRMTADESQAVIALWQQECVETTGLTDKPAVPDVAEGLDVSVEDVQRLLSEVRARRLEEERAFAAEQELSQIRLAEEERKLAEVRRQRAEMRREQAASQRQQEQLNTEQEQRFHSTLTAAKREYSPVAIAVATIGVIIWLFFMVSVFSQHHNHSSFDAPSASDCAVTGPDGKPEPCSPEMKSFIENGINQQTHR